MVYAVMDSYHLFNLSKLRWGLFFQKEFYSVTHIQFICEMVESCFVVKIMKGTAFSFYGDHLRDPSPLDFILALK